MKKLENVEEVILELDLWLQHYVTWIGLAPGATKKAIAFEKARNVLAEVFGDPTENGKGGTS